MTPSPPAPGRTGADEGRGGIQVVRRAAAVLRVLGDQPGGLRLTDLALEVDLPKTTVHRLVGALADEGLVRTDPLGLIWLGPTLAALAGVAAGDLARQLRPALLSLHQQLHETVDLAVLDGPSVRFIDQVQGSSRLHVVSEVGARFPLHCTANGKALLAALPPAQAERLLPATLERFTASTTTDRSLLLAELARIREEGVAYDRQEHTVGIVAVGTAVLAADGPVAAISVPVPSERAGTIDELAPALARAGRGAANLLVDV
jgi:DNA-binding IclR family transcriptional regulator